MTAALRSFLIESYAGSFQWGERDCGLWVAEWVKRMRGTDPAQQFRGHYKTALGCARLVQRYGGLLQLSIAAFAAAGLKEIDAAEAAPGDIACVHATQGPTLGVVTGNRVAMIAHRGIVVSAAYPILRAWKV